MTWESQLIIDDLTMGNYEFGQERVLSFLPLSHVVAQIGYIHNSMRFGATVYFADRDALRGSLVMHFEKVLRLLLWVTRANHR